MEQAVSVYVSSGGLPSKAALELLVFVEQNPPNVVSSGMARVQGLSSEDVNDSLVEVDDTAQWQIEELFDVLRSSCQNGLFVFFWEQPVILDDSICIAEITNEVDHDTMRLADEPPEPAAKLLEEDTF